MITEPDAAGLGAIAGFASVPRIQIVTIEQAMALPDRAVRQAARYNETFRKAARETDGTRQKALDLQGAHSWRTIPTQEVRHESTP